MLYVWSSIAWVQCIFGFAIIPATLYGVLQCIRNAVQGKHVREFLKLFIWTAVGLILIAAPSCYGAMTY